MIICKTSSASASVKCLSRIVTAICHGIPLVVHGIDTKFSRVNSSIVSERDRPREDGWQFSCCRHLRLFSTVRSQMWDLRGMRGSNELKPWGVCGKGTNIRSCQSDWKTFSSMWRLRSFKSEKKNVTCWDLNNLRTLTGSTCDRLRRGDKKVKIGEERKPAMAWDKKVKGVRKRWWRIESQLRVGLGLKTLSKHRDLTETLDRGETVRIRIRVKLSRSG